MEVMYFLKCISSKVCLSKVYFFEMYPTCVSSKLCEFIRCDGISSTYRKLHCIAIVSTLDCTVVLVLFIKGNYLPTL